MRYILLLLVTVTLLGSLTGSVLAQSGGSAQSGQSGGSSNLGNYSGSGNSGGLQNPINANSIAELFQAIIDIIMIFAIPIIVFFIVYAGFLYVTARGNTETIQKAHRALLYALIGALLIVGANVLIQVVGGTVDSVTGGNTNIIR